MYPFPFDMNLSMDSCQIWTPRDHGNPRSWGPNVPPDKLAAAVCSDIKEDGLSSPRGFGNAMVRLSYRYI